MRKFLRLSLSYTLALTILMFVMPVTPNIANVHGQQENGQQRTARNALTRRGPEVAARVRRLFETNRGVRAAFQAFVRGGRLPRIEDALSISATISGVTMNNQRDSRNLSQRVSFKPQQTTVSGNGYELTLIPSIETDSEWQGTAICTRYDESGNVAEQYAANIVTFPNADGTAEVRYEVTYGSDGIPRLSHEPGMFTGYALGTLYRDHQSLYGAPPPVNVESWQFISPAQEQQYYETYPQQRNYDNGMERPMEPPIYGPGTVTITPATYQTRQDRHIERYQLRCGTPSNPQPCTGPPNPYVGRYLLQVGAGCAGAAIPCRGNPSCIGLACAGVAVARLPVLFGY